MRLLLFNLLFCFSVFADGCFVFKTNEHAKEPEQKAVIFYDDGIQDTFLQVKFDGKASEFGWLVPIPSKPQFSQVKNMPNYPHFGGWDIPPHDEIGNYLMYSHSYARNYSSIYSGFIATENSLMHSQEEVIKPRISDIKSWLVKNDFELSEPKMKIIQDYCDRGWYFCAVKVRLRKEKSSPTSLTPPIKLSFKTDKPVYPVRLMETEKAARIKVTLISPRVYVPSLNFIKDKDVFSEKEFLKRVFIGSQEFSNKVPLTVGRLDNLNCTSRFQIFSNGKVYPSFYVTVLDKKLQDDEMSEDIYFYNDENLVNQHYKQLYRFFMKKGYRSKYVPNFYGGGKNWDLASEKYDDITHFSSYEACINHLLKQRCGTLDKWKMKFAQFDKAGEVHFKKELNLADLKNSLLNSFKNGDIPDELSELVNYRVAVESLLKKFNEDDFADSFDGFDDFDDDFDDDSGNENDITDYSQSLEETDLAKFETIADYYTYNPLPKYYPRTYIDNALHLMQVFDPSIKIQEVKVADSSVNKLRQLVLKSEKLNVFNRIKIEPMFGIDDNQSLAMAGISHYDPKEMFYILQNTPLYLRKIVDNVLDQGNEMYFYAFADEAGEHCSENKTFAHMILKKDPELIQIIVPWLKSSNKYLRHNAIVALFHLSFLSPLNYKEVNDEILKYRDELDEHLPLNPFDDLMDGKVSYWHIKSDGYLAYILRLKYKLNTKGFAEAYFELLGIVDKLSLKPDELEDLFDSIEYMFCNFDEYSLHGLLAEVCCNFSTKNLIEDAEYRPRELFWAELAMSIHDGSWKCENVSEFIKKKVKQSIVQNNKKMTESREKEKSYKWRFWNFNCTSYYASAFIEDEEVREVLINDNSFPDLVVMREHTHEHLKKWLENQFEQTGNLKYNIWQPLCVPNASLSWSENLIFHDNLNEIIRSQHATSEMINGAFIIDVLFPERCYQIHKPGFIQYPLKGGNEKLFSGDMKKYKTLSELDDDFFGVGRNTIPELMRIESNLRRLRSSVYYGVEMADIIEMSPYNDETPDENYE